MAVSAPRKPAPPATEKHQELVEAEQVAAEVAENGIRIVSCDESGASAAEIERHFLENIFPVLTPLAIGPGPSGTPVPTPTPTGT